MQPLVSLRPVTDEDLPIFFEQQLDAGANYMAAFTPPDPRDRAVFEAHWARNRQDPEVTHRTIVCDGQVAGYIARFLLEGEPMVGYWLGGEFWGRGVATAALRLFLEEVTERPLHARVAFDNVASRRVLEKCGFTVTGTGYWYANARREEIEELFLVLPTQTDAP